MRTALTILLALAAPATAQEVLPCDWQASARNIVEPWADNTRIFANGDVRVAALDTIEPAVGFAFLMVLSPPFDEVGSRQCAVIGHTGGGSGFAGMDFAKLQADYDPTNGLILQVPVNVFDPNLSTFPERFLTVEINQTNGDIQPSLAVARQ